MTRSVATAAWIAALALVVIAGITAYATFFQPSWVEYEACLESNGYVVEGDPTLNRIAEAICTGE